ncbi:MULTISPECIES: CidA/LrgA family protein [Metabacillus]|uniref:CidA/LrgA family holin-like protein n=1 Tax=Metabacillus hrfriensis TaxID=3048891 RepID=A0ACD4R8Z1_9BACI|nr:MULTISPECIES: CidA/LrgA family holin-like protein [Metabacillus]UAL51377.1 CidA/LrgA family holin-like protein [Metabacillus dongyingensis]WHZ56884.1 CidA/LrgA family holin-like protein [Metabacillus sp. CT-WN-B3]
MKWIKILIQIACLYLFYQAGVFIQQYLQLSMPGSIIGMFLLFFCLSLKIIRLPLLKEGSSMLLSHLSLLFIPATVGLIDHFDLFSGKGLVSALVALFSTALVMISSAAIGQRLTMRTEASEKRGEV